MRTIDMMTETKENINKIHVEMKNSGDLTRKEFNKLLKKYKKEVDNYDKYFNEFCKLIDYIDNTIS